MADYCKGCRFFDDEGNCTARNIRPSAQMYACSSYSAYSSRNPDGLKLCKDCRFFNGKCSLRKFTPATHSQKCSDGSICR